MTRAIEPGKAPGGIVFKVIATDGTPLLLRPIPGDQVARAEELATEDATDVLERAGTGWTMFVFDGDSGQLVAELSPGDLVPPRLEENLRRFEESLHELTGERP